MVSCIVCCFFAWSWPGFASARARVGERAIQRIGLAAPSNDANTGDIVAPLQSFAQMRDGLKDIQAQVSGHWRAVDRAIGGSVGRSFFFSLAY